MRVLTVISIIGFLSPARALGPDGNGPTRADAVALYVFSQANYDAANRIYRDLAPNPLDLQIFRSTSGAYITQPDHLEIVEPNLIRSIAPANKIVNACKGSNEMTIEVWLTNRTPAEKLVNHEDDKLPAGYFKQSLRIVSLGDTYFKEFHNFGLYQGYNMGDIFKATTRTSGNSGGSLSGDFIDPLLSAKETFLPQTKQHLIYVKTNGGARFYASDESGVDTLALKSTRGFGGNHSNWHTTGTPVTLDTPDDNTGPVTKTLDMRLAIGNEPSADNDFGKPTIGGEGPDKRSRHWPWVGKIYMVAIYCRALTDYEILGEAAPHLNQAPLFDIDLGLKVTKSLKRAQEIYTRLTGVRTPIYNPALSEMARLIDNNQSFEAAEIPTQDPNFLNITVRDMAAKMSTREETISVPLNDFTATMIGAVRDHLDFSTMLSRDIVYEADPARAAVPSNLIRDKLTSNRHYESLGTGGFDLQSVLRATTQSYYDGSKAVPAANFDTAGLITTRGWMAAHAVAGTNRRMVEYAFREFLCTPIDKWADSNGSDAFVGRDVDRFPGGSHTKFTTTCRACHSRMDPLRGAFAYFTFSNNFTKHSFAVPHLPQDTNEANSMGMGTGLKTNDPALTQLPDLKYVSYVAGKMNHNEDVFPGGRVIIDNSFQNAAVDAFSQAYFGWNQATLKGKGAAEFGAMIAQSEQFSRCMARRVFSSVCKREPEQGDEALISSAATEFKSQKYRLDYLFKRLVVTPNCLGEDK